MDLLIIMIIILIIIIISPEVFWRFLYRQYNYILLRLFPKKMIRNFINKMDKQLERIEQDKQNATGEKLESIQRFEDEVKTYRNDIQELIREAIQQGSRKF